MIKKITILVAMFLFTAASVSFAAENESWIQKMKNKFQKKEVAAAGKTAAPKKDTPAKEMKKAEAPVKQRKDMTKDELAAGIVKNLDREDSILNLVPGLEKKIDPEGKEYYTYNGTRIEDLDRDTLDGIFGRVRSESVRLRTDRLTKQLETARRANAVMVTVPQAPRVPVIPKVNIPPQTPRPVQPPSRPSAPPAPPRR